MLSSVIIADKEAKNLISRECLNSYSTKAHDFAEKISKSTESLEKKLCRFSARFLWLILDNNPCSNCIKYPAIQKCVWQYALIKLSPLGTSSNPTEHFEIFESALELMDGKSDPKSALDELLARFATD